MGIRRRDKIWDCRTINTAVHLLFLVESLLLKKAAQLISPGVRPRKLNLLVEELRPRGSRAALEAAGFLPGDKGEFLRLLEGIIMETARRKIPRRGRRRAHRRRGARFNLRASAGGIRVGNGPQLGQGKGVRMKKPGGAG